MISENPDVALSQNVQKVAYLAAASSRLNSEPITRASANRLLENLVEAGDPVAHAAIALRDGVLNPMGHPSQPDDREVLRAMDWASRESSDPDEIARLTYLAGNALPDFVKTIEPQQNADALSSSLPRFQSAVQKRFGLDGEQMKNDQYVIDLRKDDRPDYRDLDPVLTHSAKQLEIVRDALAQLPEDKPWIANNLKEIARVPTGLLRSFQQSNERQGLPENSDVRNLLDGAPTVPEPDWGRIPEPEVSHPAKTSLKAMGEAYARGGCRWAVHGQAAFRGFAKNR